MTAPDDMPDHIWAQTHPGTDRQGRWSAVDLNTYAPASKYVRADLVDELVRALEEAYAVISRFAQMNDLEIDDERIDHCKVELEPYNGWVTKATLKASGYDDKTSGRQIRHWMKANGEW